MEPDDDIQLMLELKKGNEKAFDEIVRRFQKKILNLIYRYLSTNYLFADDLAQEVFLRVYKSRDSYKPTAKLSTWIFRIAINLCLNEQRAAKPAQFSSLSTSKDENSDDFASSGIRDEKNLPPPEELERKELRRAVKSAIDNLPEKQKLAIILNKYEQMSYEDIARTMGISVEAVKSILFRARENLKIALIKYIKK